MTLSEQNRAEQHRYGGPLRLLGLAAIFVLVQVPALKIHDIKPIEAVGIIALILNIRTLSAVERNLAAYFSLFLLLGLALNPLHSFPESAHGHFLKRPYLISIARYVEYMSLVGFVVLVRSGVRRHGPRAVVGTFIAASLAVQASVLLFYLLQVWSLELVDVAYLENDSLRLKGFFIEGGPLGLFNSFLIVMILLYDRGARRWALGAFLLVFIVLGKSKAGLTALAAWACATTIVQAGRLIRGRGPRLCFRLAACGVFVAVFLLMASVYLVDLADRDGLVEIIEQDPGDFWVSGGRVPGYFIVTRMFAAHPVLGIGMGNYQFLRNAERYRDFMPETAVWDLHGYGGLVEIVNQFGLLGLALFLVIVIQAFRPLRAHAPLLTAFLVPFAFGLSLHFHYPWLILGLLPAARCSRPVSPSDRGPDLLHGS